MTSFIRSRQALLSASLLICPALAASAQEQTVSTAGSLLSRPAHLQVANVPLRVALAQLVETSEVPIALSPSRLPKDVQVSCACDTVTVGAALTVLLANTSITFSEAGGYVLLIPSSMSRERAEDTYQALTRSIANVEHDVTMTSGTSIQIAPLTKRLEPAARPL